MKTKTLKEKKQFLIDFIKNPSVIWAITPSSKKLSKKMVEQIDFENANSIIELWAWTWPFTELIVKKKKSKTKYLVFEKNKDLQKILKNKFENLEIYEKAEELSKILENQKVDYVISWIPYSVVGKDIRKAILEWVYDSLEEWWKFVLFQYSWDLRKYLKKKYKWKLNLFL